MLIGGQKVNLFKFRNYLGEPSLTMPPGISLDTLLTALEETSDPRLIASFARHIAAQEDCISLEPLLKKYSDELPMYTKKALWQAIAASVRNEDPPIELIERVLSQPDLPFQLLLNVFRTCSDDDIYTRCREEENPQKHRAINKVIKERFGI